MSTAITPPAFGDLPLGESEAIDVELIAGANGQIPGNAQPWITIRFKKSSAAWAAGVPADLNFAGTSGTTYVLINDAPGPLTIKARAASSTSIQLLPTERALCVMVTDPATNSVEFRKISSVVDDSSNSVNRARGVITVALAAYTAASGTITANANGAIGVVMDGLTPAVGDTVFLAEGIAANAKDAGPYQVLAIGDAGTPFVLTRPGWYKFGALITPGLVIKILYGNVYTGSEWKSFVADFTKVVDTDAPLFFSRNWRRNVQITNGTVTVAGGSFLNMRTGATIALSRTLAGAATANTVEYQALAATRTAGAIGTASVVIMAALAAGTINVADTVTNLDVTVTNW